MHDREFTKPHPVTMKLPLQPGQKERATIEYALEDLLAEFAWAYPKWNEEENWQEAQIRIAETVEDVEPGGLVKLGLGDWEKLRESLKAAKMGGVNVARVRRLQLCVLQARAPKKEEVAQA